MLYRAARLVLQRAARHSPRWWLAARPAYRLMRVAAAVLETVVERPFNHKDPTTVPAYLSVMVKDHIQAALDAAENWVALVDEWRYSPTLCPTCGAPAGQFEAGKGCGRCPPELTIHAVK